MMDSVRSTAMPPNPPVVLGVDAKVTSLGKAFNANELPANAVFYNPAKLTFSNKGTFSGLLTKPYGELEDVAYNAFGVSLPLLKKNLEYPPIAFGLNALMLSADNIREADNNGLTGNLYTSKESAIMLGCGTRFNEKFSLGVGLKYFSQRIHNLFDKCYAIDAGIVYEYQPFISFEGVVNNLIASDLKLWRDNQKLPFGIKLGLQCYLMEDLRFFLASDFKEKKSIEYNFGLDYNIIESLFLRAGYNNSDEEYSLGCGVRIKNSLLDYSYNIHPALDGFHRLTLALEFGGIMLNEKIKPAAIPAAVEAILNDTEGAYLPVDTTVQTLVKDTDAIIEPQYLSAEQILYTEILNSINSGDFDRAYFLIDFDLKINRLLTPDDIENLLFFIFDRFKK